MQILWPGRCAAAVNGSVKEELLTNQTSNQISQLLTKLTNQAGLEAVRIRKPFHTANPSIQGQWQPFTHRPPSLNAVRPPPGGVADTWCRIGAVLAGVHTGVGSLSTSPLSVWNLLLLCWNKVWWGSAVAYSRLFTSSNVNIIYWQGSYWLVLPHCVGTANE